MANTSAPTLSPQQQAANARQMNMNIRGMLLATCVPMFQPIYSNAIDPTAQPSITIPVLNVGLVRGFLLKVAGTITNSSAATNATLTPLGASNAIAQVIFTDMNNQQRINTTGWHLSLINSAKQPMVFGGAYMPNVPMGYGNNWTVMTATTPLTHAPTDAPFQYYWWLPASYSKMDLTGAMYANVLNATANIKITLLSQPCIPTGSDSTLAIYSGPASVDCIWKAGTKVTVTVFQDYLDQVPMTNTPQGAQPVLPQIDVRTMYQLVNTAFPTPVAGQANPIPYANFRTYLSTSVIYDNGGVLNTGSDISRWELQAANTTALINEGPSEAALMARTVFHADPPAGVYYFDHRDRPIQTLNYGNMQLAMYPIAPVAANAAMLVGWEFFADLSNVAYASSLPAGN